MILNIVLDINVRNVLNSKNAKKKEVIPLKEKLTPKQERFVQNIVSGMTQRQAYKEAYDNNMTDKQLDEEACKLFNSPKIHQRYRELMDKLDEEAIMSAKERMIWLSGVVTDIIKEKIKADDIEMYKTADLNTKLKAIDILNKMSGEYVTKVSGNLDLSYEKALREMADTDEY